MQGTETSVVCGNRTEGRRSQASLLGRRQLRLFVSVLLEIVVLGASFEAHEVGDARGNDDED